MENSGVRLTEVKIDPHDIVFQNYVDSILELNSNDEPLCPFLIGGECYILAEQRKEGACLKCEMAKLSYNEQLRHMARRKLKGYSKGAPVFCVSCGAGKRTPLRKWYNSYICENCWKLLQAIGEDAFLDRLSK